MSGVNAPQHEPGCQRRLSGLEKVPVLGVRWLPSPGDRCTASIEGPGDDARRSNRSVDRDREKPVATLGRSRSVPYHARQMGVGLGRVDVDVCTISTSSDPAWRIQLEGSVS